VLFCRASAGSLGSSKNSPDLEGAGCCADRGCNRSKERRDTDPAPILRRLLRNPPDEHHGRWLTVPDYAFLVAPAQPLDGYPRQVNSKLLLLTVVVPLPSMVM
jgi:hypothetical protein